MTHRCFFVAAFAVVLCGGCIPGRCSPAPEVPFATLLEQAVASPPRTIDSTVTLESVQKANPKKLEFHYALTETGKSASKNSQGKSLRKTAAAMMASDPLAISAIKKGVEIEHIFNDPAGSLVLSLVIRDSEPLEMPVKAEAVRTKANVTGVQTNPFLN